MGVSDFGAINTVKWQIPVFDGKATSWRAFELKGIMAMQHLHLDSVLDGGKEEIPVVNKAIFRYRLHAHHGKSKIAKYFALWSLISSSWKTDADKRDFSVRSRQN